MKARQAYARDFLATMISLRGNNHTAYEFAVSLDTFAQPIDDNMIFSSHPFKWNRVRNLYNADEIAITDHLPVSLQLWAE